MTRLPATRQQQGDAVGLLWQKIVPIVRSRGQEGEDRDKDPVVRGVADSRAPAEWPAAFHRLVRRTPPGPTRAVGTFRAQGRVLCGLGLPNGLDNGLSLHPVYGVPYLPGSSLKGITRAWCRERYAGTTWGDATPGSALAELLGLGDDDGGPLGGVVAFFDAPWVPVADQRPWAVEIVTPHMVGYYADKRGQTPPDGVEAPKPNPYLAAEGSFRVVIEGPEGWVDRAMTLLTEALRERGVGAKTRAGYGRLLPGPDHDADRAARAAASERAARAAADAEAARLRAELRAIAEPDARLARLAEARGADVAAEVARAWLIGQAEELEDVAPGADAVGRVARWLYARQAAKGAVAALREAGHAERAAWFEAALAAPAPEPPKEAAAVGFGPNALDPSAFPTAAQLARGKPGPNDFATRIARGRFDEPTVRAALAHLEANGAKAGHLSLVRRAYGLEG